MSESVESVAKAARKQSLRKQADEVASVVDDFAARQNIEHLPSSDVLPTGINVLPHPRIWRHAYGALKREIDAFLRIAEEEGLLLSFRSRSPAAAALIDAGKALLKPHGVSIKTVGELDIRFLGYPKKFEGLCALVSPPMPWTPRGFDRDVAVESYLNRFPELNGASPDSLNLRAQVEERLRFQLDEWPKQVKNFRKYKNDGIDVDFYGEKNGLGFDDIPNENQKRGARLIREDVPPAFEGEPTRFSYLLEMEDASGSGRFLPIGGDIDFLGMFKLDGSLPDLPTRIRVYKKLRAAGLQHGESFTFHLKDLRDKFLRCCSPPPFGDNEKMLTATPDGQLITTQFRDELSIIEGGGNSALKVGNDEFAYLDGVITEVSSAARPGTPVLPTSAVLTYEGYPIVSIATAAKLVSDLDAVIDRRNGQLVRVGPDGMPEIYVPPSEPLPPGLNPLNRFVPSGSGGMARLRVGQNFLVDSEIEADLADLIAAGYVNTREITPPGSLGGQWWPVSSGEIQDWQEGEMAGIAPFTYLTRDVPEGASILPVLSSKQMGVSEFTHLFAVGDRVVLDPGGVNEEFASILSVHPLTLSHPLSQPKQVGTLVLFLSGVSDAESIPGALPASENLFVWLRAGDGVERDGANVVSWTDQSPNQFVFAAPSAERRPLWNEGTEAGFPSVRFQSSQLLGNLEQTLTNATIFTLCRFTPSGNSEVVYAFGTPNFSGLMMSLARRNGDGADHYDGRVNRIADNTIPGTEFRVFSQVYGEGGGDRHRLAVNQQTVLDTRTTTGRAYSAVTTNVFLGTWINGASAFDGDLVEWLVYDRVLNLEERLDVEEYLRQRVGLPPFVEKGSLELADSEVVNFDTSDAPEGTWSFDSANRTAILPGPSDPSMLLTPLQVPGEAIHLRIRAGAGSGSMGVVFGYQGPNRFQLMDWRQVTSQHPIWGVAPLGMRLRSFHLPQGQQPTGADFGAGADPSRVTTWKSNTFPWVANREYDVKLTSDANQTAIEVKYGMTTLAMWIVPELKGVTGRFGHYVEALPDARFSRVVLPGQEPLITHFELGKKGTSTLRWVHGTPPFVIESIDDLSTRNWYPVSPATFNFSQSLPDAGNIGIFRVRSAGVATEPESGEHSQTFGNAGDLWFVQQFGSTRIEAENFDAGGQGVAYHDTIASNNGGVYRMTDVDIGAIGDIGGGYAVGWVAAGEWLNFSIHVEKAGVYSLRARTARGRSGNSIARFFFGGENKTGDVLIPATGNWGIYATVTSSPFELSAGSQILQVDMAAGSYDLNWIEIVPQDFIESGSFGNLGNPWTITRTAPTRIEAENFDIGGESVGYHETSLQNIGGQYREDAVDLYASADEGAGYCVGWISAGEWLDFTVDVQVAGTYRLRARTSRGSSGNRSIRFLVDGEDKTGNLVVPRTANWSTYTTVESETFELNAGRQILRADMTSSDFNLNWIEIVPQ